MSDLHQLHHEHAHLLNVVARLREAIASSAPPSLTMLSDLRNELSSTLLDHLQVEDETLYPRLMASGDPAIASAARRFSDEMGGLAAAYSLYAKRWGTLFIAANWSGYCHETRDIIDQLTNRIARESREIYPLLESLDQAA